MELGTLAQTEGVEALGQKFGIHTTSLAGQSLVNKGAEIASRRRLDREGSGISGDRDLESSSVQGEIHEARALIFKVPGYEFSKRLRRALVG